MSTRTLLAIPLLVLWMMIAFVAGGIASDAIASFPEVVDPPPLLPRLLGAMALQALVLVWFIRRSAWCGLPLAAATAFLFFAVQTGMAQMETLWFNAAFGFTARQLLAVVVMGAVMSLLFSPVAVAALGRWRRGAQPERGQAADAALPRVTPARAAILAVTYTALYFVFGYFVAWRSDAVRLLYAGSAELLPFHRHLAHVLETDPLLPLFQLGRGLVWAWLCLFALRAVAAGRAVSRWEAALLVAALLAVLMNAQHLLPNPYMSPAVQLAHFLETATSNALFGGLAAFVLTRGTQPRSALGPHRRPSLLAR